MQNYLSLPTDLPTPLDDGACAHLMGSELPDVTLSATLGNSVNLGTLTGWSVIYIYPMTGVPGVPLPIGWDTLPGARGCTPQSCGFRDHFAELQQLGAGVFGLSTQATAYQLEVATRLHLPFALLSDINHAFANALQLPMFEVEGKRLIKRMTLIALDRKIVHVMYPVFPPDQNAAQVIDWLSQRV